MENFDVFIVGAGASGLAAAIKCARKFPDARIALSDRLPRVGKKILATGNGRCNITNRNATADSYRNSGFASHTLTTYSPDKVLKFFSTLGLETYTDSEGRVYPLSNMAAGVLDALRLNIPDNVTVITNCGVNEVKKTDNGFRINNEYTCKKLIIACGGKASPSQGSNGSGYAVAESLGHSVTKLFLSLCPLCADTSVTKPLKGVRIHKAKITISAPDGRKFSSTGEILFTEYGISGIAAMELCADFLEISGTSVKGDTFTCLDFLPDFSMEELTAYLKNLVISSNKRDFDNLLSGILPKAVGITICKAVSLYNTRKSVSELTENDLSNIAYMCKNFSINLTGSRGFDSAQVTRGGINTSEINPETMESLICPGLFFCGEIIDVDGACGGYNLQWAWASGLLAGELGGNL